MKKMRQKFRPFGEDPPNQIMREVAILALIILVTVALGFVFVR